MATQQEILDSLAAAKASLASSAEKIAKVGTETDALQVKITELLAALENQSAPSPELVAAVKAVADGAAAVATAASAVDDKVPDPVPTATA